MPLLLAAWVILPSAAGSPGYISILIVNGSCLWLLQGAVATLSGSKLVCLNSAAGSPKLDLAMTLDIQATAEQYGFAAKMRNQTIEQLKSLETWVERQATGLDMAANPDSLRSSFDKLLKVITFARPVAFSMVASLLVMLSYLLFSHKS